MHVWCLCNEMLCVAVNVKIGYTVGAFRVCEAFCKDVNFSRKLNHDHIKMGPETSVHRLFFFGLNCVSTETSASTISTEIDDDAVIQVKQYWSGVILFCSESSEPG